MTNYKTTFEATRNLPAAICIGHGENADLNMAIQDDGVPVALSGYSVRAIYQPSSKWGTTDFYECPAEIAGNEAIVHWGNTYDNGDDAVKMWVRFEKGGKVSYPALYQLNLFKTPGFDPSTITPIPEVIDFGVIPYRNAPWMLSAAFSAWLSNDYTPTKQTLSGNVSTLSAKVNTLSANGVEGIVYWGENGQEVKEYCYSHPNAYVIWDNPATYIGVRTFFFRSMDYENIWLYTCFLGGAYGCSYGYFTLDYNPGTELQPDDLQLLELPLADRSFVNTQISAAVGNINSVLDSINGEVI